MNWQPGINHVLHRLLGYELISTEALALLEQRAAAGDRRRRADRKEMAKQLARLREQVDDIQVLTRPKPKPAPGLPADYDDDMRQIWPKVKDRTMNLHEKVYFLLESVRYLERHRIEGAIVECGVWRGGSMLAVAHMLSRLGAVQRDLYLFDTYSGMTEPNDRDTHIWAHKPATEIMATKDAASAPIWAAADVEDVRSGFSSVAYPAERLHFIPGRVEDTIPGQAPDRIALLRLDTDWYESTKHELEHLYHRLAPGGVLVIDDYGSWQGSKDATDEFLANTGEPLMLTKVGRGRVAVRPGLRSLVPEPAESPA